MNSSAQARLIDTHGRAIDYLRLSVTDRCNLRCSYCMPEEGLPVVAKKDLLSDDDLLFLSRTAVSQGIRKIRITGGEPLLRPGLADLLGRISALDGLDKLVLTTNGSRLETLAGPLKDAGVQGVNISIDSLRADRFHEISRDGHLDACRDGIVAAMAVGLDVKLNVVVMRGVNDDEILNFVRFGLGLPAPVRFIEHMPTAGRTSPFNLTIPSSEVLETIGREFDLIPLLGSSQAGPSRNYRVGRSAGIVGVISPLSHRFCALCNRLRVTANGLIRSCLFQDQDTDLRPSLEARNEEELAEALRRAVLLKPASHHMGEGQHIPDLVFMSRMGG
jgi:GTP 3',8-cyclase